MNRSQIVRQLTLEYAQRRRDNEQELDARLRRAAQADRAIAALTQMDAQALRTQASVFLQSPDQSIESMKLLRAQAAQRRDELRQRLAAAGLPEDYLEPIFNCRQCRDTGFVGEEVRRHCPCFERALRDRVHQSSGLAGLDWQNFESFDESVFPDEPIGDPPISQRSRALAARDLCLRYADQWPASDKLNVILMGESGLGKTFLLNCIAARVLERGHDALRLTAYQMFSAMRACHMGDDDGERRFRELNECPLLLIDDIGTEPLYKNITIEYFFILLNERQVNRRHTVIATNLSVAEIKSRYGERVMSRLFTRQDAHRIRLTGRDLRL